MQGSTTSQPVAPTLIACSPQAIQAQQQRLLVVREVGSLSAGITAIANACCHENHVTMDQIEDILHLSRQMSRAIAQLGTALSD
ncbi:hypothetical protein ACF8GD_00380 [Pseudomonas putida]|uniref:hypothetical protein n=1 Tax=Pseudomonas putida TaxID=303 RepID=UPI00370A5873